MQLSPQAILLSALLAASPAHPQTPIQNTPTPVELSTHGVKLTEPVDRSKPIPVSGGIAAGAILRSPPPVYPPEPSASASATPSSCTPSSAKTDTSKPPK